MKEQYTNKTGNACGGLHHVAATFEVTLAKRAAILICIGKRVSLSGQGSFKWDSWKSSGPDFTSGLDVEECAISGLCMGRTVPSRRRNCQSTGSISRNSVLKHDGLQGCSAFLHTLSGATTIFAPALRTMALGRVPGGHRFRYVSS